MRVERGPIHGLRPDPETVLTIGSFDGVHLGHAELVGRVVREARSEGLGSGLVTFEPHPRVVLGDPRGELRLLTPLEEKLERLAATGLDRAVVIDFTPELAAMDARAFIREGLLPRVGFRRMIVGWNHAFGRGRSGNRDTLTGLGAELGFSVEVLPPVLEGGSAVSSTRIRGLLADGEVEEAAALLGRPYRLAGEVVRGHGRGRGIGVPTANLKLVEPRQLLPAAGVYAVELAGADGPRPGMMNLGPRPTFGEAETVPEVHLFDWEGEAYGEVWHLDILRRMRDIVRFQSIEQLREQLAEDRQRIQGWLAEGRGADPGRQGDEPCR